MKSFFRSIHLYLSLLAGLIITCSCLTGTILVFEKEITQLLHHQWYYVTPQGPVLPLQQLTGKVLNQYPKATVNTITVYNDAARAVEIGLNLPDSKKNKDRSSSKKEKPVAVTGNKEKAKQKDEKYTTTVFVNPYTGQVLGQFNRKQSFLYTIEKLHRYLLAGKNSIGSTIVSVSTLIFLFILITGIILWWPKTKKIMRQRLKIKWDASGKRLVHDLHIVTGFYTSVFLTIIVLTGLIMTFKWANKALFILAGSTVNANETALPNSKYTPGAKILTFDAALQNVTNPIRNSAFFTLSLPHDSAGVYALSILKKGAIETTADNYYIDQYTGKVTGQLAFVNKSLGQRLRALVKPIHTGSIYGLPTKIISFIVCLLSLIFPVTGLMMWLNRTRKKKPSANKRLVKEYANA